jgi:hypothetical protein
MHEPNEYEQNRAANIARNEAMLATLCIPQHKADMARYS